MGVFIKSKKEKQEDIELKPYLDKIDSLEGNKDKVNDDIKFKDLFKKDPLDEELKAYMTEEQLEEEQKENKHRKMFNIMTAGILGALVISIVVILVILHYSLQDDLHKIYLKELRNYYNNKYNTHISIDDIKYICNKTDHDEICTDIIYAKTSDNHVILKYNDQIGDSNNTSATYKAYKEELLKIIPGNQMVNDNPIISYKDFYSIYHQYIDYIKVLPNKSYEELINTNKLTIRDIIIYQGDINIELFKEYLNKLSDESEFILIQIENARPVNLKVINKTNIYDMNIEKSTTLMDETTYYQLDSTINNTRDLTITKISTSSIEPLVNDSTLTNTYRVDIDRDNRNETGNNYAFMAFTQLSDNELIQFKGNRELTKDKYKNIYYIYSGSKTYIVTTEDISIGNITYNKK